MPPERSTMLRVLVAACLLATVAAHGVSVRVAPAATLGKAPYARSRLLAHGDRKPRAADARATAPRPTVARLARIAVPLLALSPVLLHSAPALALGGISSISAAVEPATGSLLDSAFFQALSLIFVSELGDKTFFIATILAARTSRLLTFIGASGALAFMTVISVAIGQIFHAVPSGVTGGIPIDDIVAVLSFTYFGVKSLRDAASSSGEGMEEEREEAEDELEKTGVRQGRLALVGEAFALTAAAELGDRSQLTTIALSAAQNPLFVCAGAIVAHCIATGGAVLSGNFISKYLSEKVIGYIGGSLFLVFAATTLYGLVPQIAGLAGL